MVPVPFKISIQYSKSFLLDQQYFVRCFSSKVPSSQMWAGHLYLYLPLFQSFQNLEQILKDDVLRENNDHSDIVRQLTTFEDQLVEKLSQQECHLKELLYTAEIVRSSINTDNSMLHSLKSFKNNVIQMKDDRVKSKEMHIMEYKQQALNLIQEVNVVILFYNWTIFQINHTINLFCGFVYHLL